jgi:hypothetical protein
VTAAAETRTPQARALGDALCRLGVACRVEAYGGLAVVVTGGDGTVRLADDEIRSDALRLAREHGFTHLAVELSAP